MPKCTKCDDIFSADEGEYNEEKEFVCVTCLDAYDDEEDLDDEDAELDEDEDEDGEVRLKACPSCKEKSEDYAESGICPDCGYEKDE